MLPFVMLFCCLTSLLSHFLSLCFFSFSFYFITLLVLLYLTQVVALFNFVIINFSLLAFLLLSSSVLLYFVFSFIVLSFVMVIRAFCRVGFCYPVFLLFSLLSLVFMLFVPKPYRYCLQIGVSFERFFLIVVSSCPWLIYTFISLPLPIYILIVFTACLCFIYIFLAHALLVSFMLVYPSYPYSMCFVFFSLFRFCFVRLIFFSLQMSECFSIPLSSF